MQNLPIDEGVARVQLVGWSPGCWLGLGVGPPQRAYQSEGHQHPRPWFRHSPHQFQGALFVYGVSTPMKFMSVCAYFKGVAAVGHGDQAMLEGVGRRPEKQVSTNSSMICSSL